MATTFRVSKPGYNALTDTDPNNFAIYADADDVLIKELARGSGTLALGSSVTINHNLGYIPTFFVWGQTAAGQYRLVNAQSPVGGGWKSYVTTTTLVITNSFSSSFTGYRYYIFYDDMSGGGTPSITDSSSVLKITRSGYNALTDTNPNHYIFHSDLNTFKILVEGLLTAQTVTTDPTVFTVAHGKSYTPAVHAFAKFPDGYVAQAGSKERANTTMPVNRYWYVETDATNIRFVFFKGAGTNYTVNIKYYIFETPAS